MVGHRSVIEFLARSLNDWMTLDKSFFFKIKKNCIIIYSFLKRLIYYKCYLIIIFMLDSVFPSEGISKLFDDGNFTGMLLLPYFICTKTFLNNCILFSYLLYHVL